MNCYKKVGYKIDIQVIFDYFKDKDLNLVGKTNYNLKGQEIDSNQKTIIVI